MTTIELRTLIKYLDNTNGYYDFSMNLEEYLNGDITYENLLEWYPEATYLLFKAKTKDLPLYVAGPYSKIVTWRLLTQK